ncbi:MAG: hypothetical protein HXY40_04135 [Chloroflexi bacterium]|nr:hypothetical protein [Chloroflexota bacterium]
MTQQAAITISVPPELAAAYDNASPEDKYKVQVWVSILLNDIAHPDPDRLTKLMDKISEEAQAKGLTPEILAETLADDE